MTKIDILRELDWILNYQTPIVPILDTHNNLFIKKEDCIPFSFGGNKCRIAASYFRDLIEKDCDVVITYGASSSNLCRVIANFANRYGLECVMVTPDELSESTCNSEMVEFLGAKRVLCPLDNVAGTIDKVISDYKSKANPYFIYGGGHGRLGTESYRNVMSQIVEYEKSEQISFDHIFITLATGTSMSGLIAENEFSNYGKSIIGISIARERDKAVAIMNESLAEENLCVALDSGKYKILGDYRCDGYGKFDDNVVDTIKNQLRINGLNLDTTYTGKSFYGMIDYLDRNNITGKNILFIHTGGTPLFFKDGCKYLNTNAKPSGGGDYQLVTYKTTLSSAA